MLEWEHAWVGVVPRCHVVGVGRVCGASRECCHTVRSIPAADRVRAARSSARQARDRMSAESQQISFNSSQLVSHSSLK